MELLSRLTIGHRLALGFCLTLALAAVAIGLAISSLSQVAHATREMMAEPLAKERLIQAWARNIHAGVRRTTAVAGSADAGMAAIFAEDQRASTAGSAELQKQIEAALDAPAEKGLYAEVQQRRSTYLAARDDVLAARKAGRGDEATQIMQARFTPALSPYLEAVEALLVHQQAAIRASADSVEATYRSQRSLLIVVASLMLILCFALAWWISLSITRPLAAAVLAAERIAAGDLSGKVKVDGRGETALMLAALDEMTRSLERQVHHIRDGAQATLVIAGEIALGNADLASRTEQGAASLEQTASALEQLATTVQGSAQTTRQANELAVAASAIAAEGGRATEQVVQAMNGIADSSRRITEIIGVIDGIAFQTNILALNAAVEAARAGEQGRGFAVVAAEVRTLAQRSAEAAREIKSLIADSSGRVESGALRAREAGGTMQQIVAQVERVSGLIAEMTHAANEQASGIVQVNTAVTQLDQMTQQNAALVEESAAAADSLKQRARALADSVAGFRLEAQA